MKTKKFIMPFLAMIGALLVALLVTYPMLSMEMKDIPVGVISLDKGMKSPAGDANLGEKMIKSLTDADNEIINWKQADSKKDLNDNMDKGKYYATLVIPENFTQDKMSGKDPKIEVVINQGKHPMVSMTLTPVFTAMGQSGNMDLNITTINKLPEDGGMKVMLIPMMLALLTIISSMLTSFMTTSSFKLKGNSKEKFKSYMIQLAYMVVGAFIIGFTTTTLVSSISGSDIEIAKTSLYLTTVSLALMLLVNGSVNLLGKKGMIIPAVIFILGMGTMQMPFEYLTSWYQTLVASWEPLKYIGDGVREVLFQNGGIWNSASIALIIISVIGIIFTTIKLVKKENNSLITKETA